MQVVVMSEQSGRTLSRAARPVSRAPAPANRASPGRSDRTTCLRPRSKGLLPCGGGPEAMSSQAGALTGPHALVIQDLMELVGSRWSGVVGIKTGEGTEVEAELSELC